MYYGRKTKTKIVLFITIGVFMIMVSPLLFIAGIYLETQINQFAIGIIGCVISIISPLLCWSGHRHMLHGVEIYKWLKREFPRYK